MSNEANIMDLDMGRWMLAADTDRRQLHAFRSRDSVTGSVAAVTMLPAAWRSSQTVRAIR
jgi:hypothetical protein